jgi:hypothetical protein
VVFPQVKGACGTLGSRQTISDVLTAVGVGTRQEFAVPPGLKRALKDVASGSSASTAVNPSKRP